MSRAVATGPRVGLRRWGGAAVAVVGTVLGLLLPMTTGPAQATPDRSVARLGVRAQPSVRITGITPRLPDARQLTQPIRVSVEITNPTAQAFAGLSLQLRRGLPISSEAALQDAIRTPPPTDNVFVAAVPVPGRLEPNRTRTQVLQAAVGAGGICLCTREPSIYPVDVVLGSAGTEIELARAHTFLPSFRSGDAGVKPVSVSWVWPLIDRPHRARADSVFLDDDLATSVGAGGRLDRALRVAETVQTTVRLTLLVDPDLIDSLTVMSGGYTVRPDPTTPARAGTGRVAAARWLERLKALSGHVDVSLTAYADPDVDALARAGVSVSTALDPQVGASVRAVLGAALTSGTGGADLAWPAGGALSSQGLDQVVGNGAAAVLLSDKSLVGASGQAVTPDAVAPLPSANGEAKAFVLSSALKPAVDRVTSSGAQPADTQVLLAQLAVRAAEDPGAAHYVVLAPTRYVDPAPVETAAAMTTIAGASWAQDMSIRAARLGVPPVDRGPLRSAPARRALSPKQIARLTQTRDQVAALRDCLSNDDAPTLLGGFSAALARAGSAAWRGHAQEGLRYVAGLRGEIDALSGEVRIVSPANASYTLASADAPLFVTVENRLDVPVQFRIKISAAAGERGLRADPVPVQTIEAATPGRPTRQQVKVQTHVARSGRFQITVTLLTPRGQTLNKPLPLRVRSTALGRAALWITGVAFGVLVLALGVRGIRRLQARRRRTARLRARPVS